MESSSDEDTMLGERQKSFVTILKDFPIIFEKSQLPNVRKRKSEALVGIKDRYKQIYGVSMTEGQLQKKVCNLKARLKKKTDLNTTGNKKIKLKAWEESLFHLMKCETNPTTNKMAGAMEIGILTVEQKDDEKEDPQPERKGRSKKAVRNKLRETEETAGLSNHELQRLVLLEKLKVLRLKKEKLLREKRQPQF